MRHTSCHFSVEQLIEDLENIHAGNRLFRIYAHSQSLFELLLSMEADLSGTRRPDNSPDDATWERLLNDIHSHYKAENEPTCKQQFLFYFGQVRMLLDCIKTRDEQIRHPGIVRLFA
jgi:hypothetical protein